MKTTQEQRDAMRKINAGENKHIDALLDDVEELMAKMETVRKALMALSVRKALAALEELK